MSRRARRAEMRRQRRAKRRIHPVTMAVALLTAIGLLVMIVITHSVH